MDITDRLRQNVRLSPAERTDLRLDALEEIESLREQLAEALALIQVAPSTYDPAWDRRRGEYLGRRMAAGL